MNKIIYFVALAVAFSQVLTVSSADKRCKYFSWMKACEASCVIFGHTTGACDENDTCWCSEEEFNFFQNITQWIDNLDIGEVIERQIDEFKQNINDWEISDKIKALVPSKCKISQDFCSKACKAIGRKSGRCNADFTDCTCSEDMVTPKQYGLCAAETVCNLRCQDKGYARGECKGQEGWNCVCLTRNNVEIEVV